MSDCYNLLYKWLQYIRTLAMLFLTASVYLQKHNKTNYVELGPFDTKQFVLMPMGAPEVQYTEVTIQR